MNNENLRGIYSIDNNGQQINPFEVLENSQYLSDEDKRKYNQYLTDSRDPKETREILEEITRKNFEGHKRDAMLEVSNRAYLSNKDIEGYIEDIKTERDEKNLEAILYDAQVKNIESRRAFGFQPLGNKKGRVLEEFNTIKNVDNEKWLENRDKVYNSNDVNEIENLVQEIRNLSNGIVAPTPVSPSLNQVTSDNQDLSSTINSSNIDADLNAFKNMGLYNDLIETPDLNTTIPKINNVSQTNAQLDNSEFNAIDELNNAISSNKSDALTDEKLNSQLSELQSQLNDEQRKKDQQNNINFSDLINDYTGKVKEDSEVVPFNDNTQLSNTSNDTRNVKDGYTGPVKAGSEVVPFNTNTDVVPIEENSKEDSEPTFRNLDSIIDDLTMDLTFKESDNRKYNAKNIKVSKSFLNKMHQGNYLYNIFGTVSSIFTPILQGAQKLYGKIFYSKRIKENIETLQERLDNLSNEDLQVLFEDYRGNVLNSRFHLNSIVNNLIGKRLRRWVLENVKIINDGLKEKYNEIYQSVAEISQIMETLTTENVSDEEYANLNNRINELTTGKADLIRSIREDQDQLDKYWLAGGGLHGMDEDIKASVSKMNLVGKRFAKIPKFDTELMHRQREFKDFEENALAAGDDLEAMIGFLSYEKLLSDNTKEKLSIFGKRSVGARDYNPLGKELDYRDDPFFRYVLGSIAVTTSTIAAVHGVSQYLATKKANEVNQTIVDEYTNKTKSSLEGHNDDLIKGQEAQIRQTNLTSADVLERKGLDETNWNVYSQEYRAIDDAHHARFNDMWSDTETKLRDINSSYNTGALSSTEALEQMVSLNSTTQNNLLQVISEYKPILDSYKANNPQFDLTAIEEAVNYITANSNAITNAGQVQVQLAKAVDALSGITLENVKASVAPAIVGALSSVVLTTTMVNGVKNFNNDRDNIAVDVTENDIHNLVLIDQAKLERQNSR